MRQIKYAPLAVCVTFIVLPALSLRFFKIESSCIVSEPTGTKKNNHAGANSSLRTMPTKTDETYFERWKEYPNSTVALCVVQKSDGIYLDEFVDYHLGLGFAHIYITDNSDLNELRRWGLDRQKLGHPISVTHLPGLKQQIPAYKACAYQARRDRHTWLGIWDVDEFLVMKKHSHVVQLAREYIQSGHLGINWRILGSSGRQIQQGYPVSKLFQFLCENYRRNRYIKSLVKLSDLEIDSMHDPHFFPRRAGTKLRDTNGVAFNGSARWKGPDDVAAIYHYYYKSWEEFIRKRMRGGAYYGTVTASAMQSALDGKDVEGNPNPNCTLFDDIVWRTLKQNVPRYALYDEIVLD